jgi:hypothetical protein
MKKRRRAHFFHLDQHQRNSIAFPDRWRWPLASISVRGPRSEKQRANLELMKAQAEKKAEEYPVKLEEWLKKRPNAARWNGAVDILLSYIWTEQAALWRLSVDGILSRVNPKLLLLKNDLQHRLRTADGYSPISLTLPRQLEVSPKYVDTLLVSGLERLAPKAQPDAAGGTPSESDRRIQLAIQFLTQCRRDRGDETRKVLEPAAREQIPGLLNREFNAAFKNVYHRSKGRPRKS